MTEQTFEKRMEEDDGEPYEYVAPSSSIPSQVVRNARGKAHCLAELDAAGVELKSNN